MGQPAHVADRIAPKPKEPKWELKTITEGNRERQVWFDMNDPTQAGPGYDPAPRWQERAPTQPQIFGSGTTGYFTLGPDGQPRQLVGAPEPGSAEATAALRTREVKIADAVRQFGVTEAEATSLVDGYRKTITDPVTGLSLSYDEATGNVRPIDEPRMAQITQQPAPDRSLYDMAGNVAGVGPTLAEAGSAITGQVGGPVAEQIIEDRQMLRSTQNELIRALSINPRFPVGEINRLREEINIAPRMWDSEDGLKARMRSVDEYLERRAQNELNAANNVNLPRETRQAASQAANDINNYRAMLGAQADRIARSAGKMTGTTSSGVGWEIVE
jgi:hypothetical protein